MRRIAIIAGAVLLVGAAGVGGTVLWVDHGLQAMNRLPLPMCMEPRNLAKIAAGTYPRDRQDGLVARTLNFQMGARHPPGAWWHLRGGVIYATYTNFWSSASRQAIFSRLAAQMYVCRSPRGLPAPPPRG